MTSLLTALLQRPCSRSLPLLDDGAGARGRDAGLDRARWSIIGLFVATVLLWLSMRKQLGKIRFDEEPARRRPTDEDAPTRSSRPTSHAGRLISADRRDR